MLTLSSGYVINEIDILNLSSEFVRPNFSGLQLASQLRLAWDRCCMQPVLQPNDLVPLFGTLTDIEKEVFHESEKSLYAGVQI